MTSVHVTRSKLRRTESYHKTTAMPSRFLSYRLTVPAVRGDAPLVGARPPDPTDVEDDGAGWCYETNIMGNVAETPSGRERPPHHLPLLNYGWNSRYRV